MHVSWMEDDLQLGRSATTTTVPLCHPCSKPKPHQARPFAFCPPGTGTHARTAVVSDLRILPAPYQSPSAPLRATRPLLDLTHPLLRGGQRS